MKFIENSSNHLRTMDGLVCLKIDLNSDDFIYE